MLKCYSHRQTTAANAGVRDENRLALPRLLNSHITASFVRVPKKGVFKRKVSSTRVYPNSV